MNKWGKVALAAALLTGTVGTFAATQARAEGPQDPFYLSPPTPAPETVTNGTVGTPIPFDVAGWDADAVPPTITFQPGDNTSAAQITQTAVPIDGATGLYETEAHFVFTASAPGNYGFTTILSDGNTTVRRNFFFHYADNAPVIDTAPSDATLNLGDTITGAAISGHDVDAGDTASFSLTGDTAGASVTDNGGAPTVTGTFNYDATAAGVGLHEITLVLTDDAGQTDTQTFHIQVNDKQHTSLVSNGAVLQLPPKPVGLGLVTLATSATLTSHGHAVAGRTVHFVLHGRELCQDDTNSLGVASCSFIASGLAATLNLGYGAYFLGDDSYFGSATPGALIKLGGLSLP